MYWNRHGIDNSMHIATLLGLFDEDMNTTALETVQCAINIAKVLSKGTNLSLCTMKLI